MELLLANKQRTCYSFHIVDEGRKRALLIAASILVARHLKELGGRPSPALDSLIHDAVSLTAKIMNRIDATFPVAGRS